MSVLRPLATRALRRWLALLALSTIVSLQQPAQASVITVEARGTIGSCADDAGGTLAGLLGGACNGAQVVLRQVFEVGATSLLDRNPSASLSLFSDAITVELLLWNAPVAAAFGSAAGEGLGLLSAQTFEAGSPQRPAALSSSTTQALALGQGLFTQIQFGDALSAVLSSADPHLAQVDASLLPADTRFGAVFYDSLDQLSERWSFVVDDVDSIRFISDAGTVPEPPPALLMLLAALVAVVVSVRRARAVEP